MIPRPVTLDKNKRRSTPNKAWLETYSELISQEQEKHHALPESDASRLHSLPRLAVSKQQGQVRVRKHGS
jgi:hypothetical protein